MCLYAYNKQTVLSITACVAAPRCEKRFSSIATVHCCPRTWLLPDGNIRKISHAQDLYTVQVDTQRGNKRRGPRKCVETLTASGVGVGVLQEVVKLFLRF